MRSQEDERKRLTGAAQNVLQKSLSIEKKLAGKTHELLSETVHLVQSVGHERLVEAAARLFSNLSQLENGQSNALQEMALPIRD